MTEQELQKAAREGTPLVWHGSCLVALVCENVDYGDKWVVETAAGGRASAEGRFLRPVTAQELLVWAGSE